MISHCPPPPPPPLSITSVLPLPFPSVSTFISCSSYSSSFSSFPYSSPFPFYVLSLTLAIPLPIFRIICLFLLIITRASLCSLSSTSSVFLFHILLPCHLLMPPPLIILFPSATPSTIH